MKRSQSAAGKPRLFPSFFGLLRFSRSTGGFQTRPYDSASTPKAACPGDSFALGQERGAEHNVRDVSRNRRRGPVNPPDFT